jgi:hypothetical protein
MNKYLFTCIFFFLLFPAILPAQEAIKSIEEEYYNFLALQGLTERPTLNYRTFSDSVWKIDEEANHPWQDNNLWTFHPLFGDFRMRVYGPELFLSGNTTSPYGLNDGLLWQGRGFNSLFKGGVRFEGYGVELTLLPHFAFSQNINFTIMPSAYESEYGYIWGYEYNIGVDAPQRFGNKPFFDWDLGDSEIRYTWKTLTVGFGTQAIWLGPAYRNSILHSNNAPAYPKLDIGLRRQKVVIPWINWYAGDIEVRLWVGQLSESKYFDNDTSNDKNLISGLAFAYSPSFLPGFTVFFNQTYTAKWVPESFFTLVDLFLPFHDEGGKDEWDIHAGAGFDYFLPQASINFYAEVYYNDTPAPGILSFISNFSHTISFTLGFKKGISINKNKNIYGELIFEYTHLEMSTFASQYLWANTFYMHHIITQGYTNRGQWIGAGIGTGGNSQFLSFNIIYPKGFFQFIISRYNPDNDFLIRHTTPYPAYPDTPIENAFWTNKTILELGVKTFFSSSKYLNLLGGIFFSPVLNNNYGEFNIYNFHLELGNKIYL